MNAWTRRDFTKTVIITGATTALRVARVAGANERVRIGFIGMGNRGDQVLHASTAVRVPNVGCGRAKVPVSDMAGC
jgi:hypothetical protein